ncbi:MAG: hypothetical protein ABIJ56_18765 [Pseudomonadota bacterium]
MLNYLVQSGIRRKLLVVLWRGKEKGSVSDLARMAGVSFAGAYGELKSMEGTGLARSSRVGSATVYQADTSHPQAGILRMLMRTGGKSEKACTGSQDRMTRAWLAGLSAPLIIDAPESKRPPGIEKVIAAGLRLAHRDASVARSLPVCIWRNRHRLDPEKLKVEARRAGETQAMGLFLDLTAELAKDTQLREWSRRMRDRRIRRTSDFFPATGSVYGRRLAEANSPPVALRWHYRMNIGMDSFESLFKKHVDLT